MRQVVVAGTACLAMLFGAVSAPAQHTLAAKFDLTKPLTLTGTVTQIDWANPYVHVLMKVPGKPLPALWAVELEGPIILANNGWSETSLAPGEVIRVEGFAARDGSKQISGKSVVVTRTGRPVYVGDERHAASAPRRVGADAAVARRPPAPRAAARADRLLGISEPDQPGRRRRQGRRWMPYGLLKQHRRRPEGGADAAVGPGPLQAPAEHVPRSAIRCSWRASRPAALVSSSSIYGFQFVEQPDFKRVFVLLGGGNRNRRTIYTDGRKHVGQIQGNDDNPRLLRPRPSRTGKATRSSSTSRGFNEEFWFDNGGLPHTEQLQLIERFTRVDMATMRYEVTIDDPGAYTRPWKSSWTLSWVPGEETPYFLCQDNRP